MAVWTSGNPFVGDELPATARKPRIDSQAKGKRAERMLANWWKANGFPDAARYVKTGNMFAPDGGDLLLEHGDFRLVIEVKHYAGGLTDMQITAFGEKLLRQTVQSKGTMGILVERRDRVSDPGRWWVHMRPSDFAGLELTGLMNWDFALGCRWDAMACRTTVGYFARQLRSAGLVQATP